jgi:hypothetical protein
MHVAILGLKGQGTARLSSTGAIYFQERVFSSDQYTVLAL